MKLQQRRFLTAVVQNDLNLTAAATTLATTQPAVSKQLKLLRLAAIAATAGLLQINGGAVPSRRQRGLALLSALLWLGVGRPPDRISVTALTRSASSLDFHPACA